MTPDDQTVFDFLASHSAYIHKNYTFLTEQEKRDFITIIYNTILREPNYDQPGSIYPVRLKPNPNLPNTLQFTYPYADDLFARLSGTGITINDHWGAVKTIVSALALTRQLDYKVLDPGTGEYGPIQTVPEPEPPPPPPPEPDPPTPRPPPPEPVTNGDADGILMSLAALLFLNSVS